MSALGSSAASDRIMGLRVNHGDPVGHQGNPVGHRAFGSAQAMYYLNF